VIYANIFSSRSPRLMDSGEAIALLGIIASSALCAVVVFGAWALGRVHERRNAIEREGGPHVLVQRLGRIEQMLETLSTDVERLLEERRGPLLPDMNEKRRLRDGEPSPRI
jgi:hypothetical protein